jgi:antitoxin FitA
MGVQITIRNVPDEVRDELAARAARARQSMQEFLRGELLRLAARPTVDVWLDRVRERKRAGATHVTRTDILRARDADRR